MRLGQELSLLTKPELERTKNILNLSNDEEIVFDLLSRQCSINEIAFRLNVSSRTVDRAIRRIKFKMDNI